MGFKHMVNVVNWNKTTWLGLHNKTTWLGLVKDHGLGSNQYICYVT